MIIHDAAGPTTVDLASARPRGEEQEPRGVLRPADAHAADGEMEAVFSSDDVDALRRMWSAIQTRFIDEPRRSVEEADDLVAATIKRLAESLTSERARLESKWAAGTDVSTEDLRLALCRCRSFFDRLLSTWPGRLVSPPPATAIRAPSAASFAGPPPRRTGDPTASRPGELPAADGHRVAPVGGS